MYIITDKKEAIRQVQRFLLEISQSEMSHIPRVSIDGIYGENTRDAVRAYQGERGLPPSGTVDRVTFDSLFDDYRLARAERAREDARVPAYLSVGSSGDAVEDLHTLLRRLSSVYAELRRVPRSTYYGKDTARAVLYLQEIFGLEPTGTVDPESMERITEEWRIRKKRLPPATNV